MKEIISTIVKEKMTPGDFLDLTAEARRAISFILGCEMGTPIVSKGQLRLMKQRVLVHTFDERTP